MSSLQIFKTDAKQEVARKTLQNVPEIDLTRSIPARPVQRLSSQHAVSVPNKSVSVQKEASDDYEAVDFYGMQSNDITIIKLKAFNDLKDKMDSLNTNKKQTQFRHLL